VADTDGDELLVLVDEPADAVRRLPADTAAPWKILIVDDQPDVIRITRTTLTGTRFLGRSVSLIGAGSAAEARMALDRHPDVALALIDVVMETNDAGLRLVRHIREALGLTALRIILRTGQPGVAPERDVVVRYDINDYRLKTDLTAQALFTSVIAGLRAHGEILARIEAERAALIASQAKSEFLANVNHELRTPLNAIIGFSDLMVSEVYGPVGNDQYREFVREILGAGRELLEVVEGILDMASFEGGVFELRRGVVRPAALFERVVRVMTPLARANGVALEVTPADAEMALEGDGRRLMQMLLNLVSHAIKASERGHAVRLGVAIDGVEAPPNGADATDIADAAIRIEIAVEGEGTAADTIRRALGRAVFSGSGVDRRSGATGLGLPLARLIAEAHGGRLEVHDHADESGGATIRVSLPLGRQFATAQIIS